MRRLGTSVAILCVLVSVLAASPAVRAAEPGVVLTSFGNVPETVARVQAVRARHVRVFLSWRGLEPQPGSLSPDLAVYDDLVDSLRAVGIGTYFVVLQTPSWASAGGAPDAPPPPVPYADFLRRLTAHFRGRVLAYEVWNEPDFPAFWQGGASPATYAALLRIAYTAAKVGDPNAKVGIGGLVGNDYSYLSALYDQGARGSFDFVGVHTDTDCLRADPRRAIRDVDGRVARGSFTGYREVRQTMLDHGDDKPIWISELGWSTTTVRCPVNRSVRAGVSPAAQAAFLRRAYACLAADPFVQMGTWFSLADAGPANSIATRFGLTTLGGARRPAFAAFQRAATVAPDRGCGLQVDRAPPQLQFTLPRDGASRSGDLYFRASVRGARTLALLVDGRQIRITGKHRLRGRWTGWRRVADGPHTVTMRAVDRARNTITRSATVNKVPYGLGEAIPTRIALRVYGGGANRLAGAALYTRPHDARALAQGSLSVRWERHSGGGWTQVGPAQTGGLNATLRSRRHLAPGRYRAVAEFAGFRSFRRAVARRTFTVV
jgi:hypothetical protein